MNPVNLIQGVVAIAAGGGVLKFGNQNYEMLKADFGLLVPLLCLVGGFGLIIYGIKSFWRAAS